MVLHPSRGDDSGGQHRDAVLRADLAIQQRLHPPKALLRPDVHVQSSSSRDEQGRRLRELVVIEGPLERGGDVVEVVRAALDPRQRPESLFEGDGLDPLHEPVPVRDAHTFRQSHFDQLVLREQSDRLEHSMSAGLQPCVAVRPATLKRGNAGPSRSVRPRVVPRLPRPRRASNRRRTPRATRGRGVRLGREGPSSIRRPLEEFDGAACDVEARRRGAESGRRGVVTARPARDV